MPKLTKTQQSILSRANSRLSNLLRLSATSNPELYYTPAVQDALNALEGAVRFRKQDLKAAKSFVRKQTSTVKGAKKYAAQQQGIRQPPSKTAENRRIINTANKRLQAMRKDGRLVPKRFREIKRFDTSTIKHAKIFLQYQSTLKRAKPRRYWQLSSAQGEKIHAILVHFQYAQLAEIYPYDSGVTEPERVSFREFASRAARTMPSISGDELAEYIEKNSPDTYSAFERQQAPRGGSVLDVLKGMTFKYDSFF